MPQSTSSPILVYQRWESVQFSKTNTLTTCQHTRWTVSKFCGQQWKNKKHQPQEKTSSDSCLKLDQLFVVDLKKSVYRLERVGRCNSTLLWEQVLWCGYCCIVGRTHTKYSITAVIYCCINHSNICAMLLCRWSLMVVDIGPDNDAL